MAWVLILALEILILFFLSRSLTGEVYYFLYRLTKKQKWSRYFLAIIFLPGTFLHEISHFLTALFLLVPVGEIELIPKLQDENRIKMGSVSIGKTDPIRKALIGISPIVFGLALIFALLWWASSQNLINHPLVVLALAIAIFEIGNTMFSSKRDLEGTWLGFALVAIVIAGLYYLGIRVDVTNLIQKANLFLLVPITIDIVVLISVKLVSK